MPNVYPLATVFASTRGMVRHRPREYSFRMTTLGERLRRTREGKGLSQSALARAIGVRSQTINQWESGAKSPSRDNLLRFVRTTGGNLAWLLYGHHQIEPAAIDAAALRGTRGRFVAMVTIDQAVRGERDLEPAHSVYAHFPTGPNAVAFELPDNSCAPSHPAGALWIIDPDEPPQPGDLVLGRYGTNLIPVFGRYRVEASPAGHVRIIEPLNRDWPAARSDIEAVEVIAVMTEHTGPRRKNS